MKPVILAVAVMTGMLLANLGEAQAQLFSAQKKQGAGISRLGTSAKSNSEMAGSALQGNERFIRGNRRSGDFVGKDGAAQKGFVGAQQMGGARVESPVLSRIAKLRNNVNVAASQPKGAYQPRVAVSFDVPRVAADALTATVARQLATTPGLHPTDRIEVSVAEGTATLRGQVASERDRSLIETLLLLEPGILTVRNDLKVMPAKERSEGKPLSSPLPPLRTPSERSASAPAPK